jgi:MoxR-like ATPase
MMVLEAALYEMKKVVVGQEALLRRLLVALMVQGHVLVEGAPGLAKTLALKTMAQLIQVDFKRIQFTPDLLPSDLIGTRVYHPMDHAFTTEFGPIFTHFLLADEINRAPAKVQSALLEAMEERQVTIGRETHPLKAPFMVMATQNPLESEGTYPLPDAQLDRFLFKVLVHYPDTVEELSILQRAEAGFPTPEPLLSLEMLLDLQVKARQVYLDPTLEGQIVALVQASRKHPWVATGASPRGTLAMARAAKANALLHGRDYATPEDVQEVAADCLRHRLRLTYEALAEGHSADALAQQLVTQHFLPVLSDS